MLERFFMTTQHGRYVYQRRNNIRITRIGSIDHQQILERLFHLADLCTYLRAHHAR